MTDKMNTRITALRKERKLSMEEFGKQLTPPVTKGTVSNWENGHAPLNEYRKKQIADFFGVSVQYLETGERTSTNIVFDTDLSNYSIEEKNTSVKDTQLTNDVKAFLIDQINRSLESCEHMKIEQLQYIYSAILFAKPKLTAEQYNFMKAAVDVAELDIDNEILNHLTRGLKNVVKQINTPM